MSDMSTAAARLPIPPAGVEPSLTAPKISPNIGEFKLPMGHPVLSSKAGAHPVVPDPRFFPFGAFPLMAHLPGGLCKPGEVPSIGATPSANYPPIFNFMGIPPPPPGGTIPGILAAQSLLNPAAQGPAAAMAAMAAAVAASGAGRPLGFQYPALFSREDLEMSLYGYARSRSGGDMPGHAVSGLKVSDVTQGIGKILCNPTSGGGPTILGSSSVPPQSPKPDLTNLQMPQELSIFQSNFAGVLHHGIYCVKPILKGTRFGPFRGKAVNASEIKARDDNTHMWEVFKDNQLSHFVDGRGSGGNWMAFVNCARHMHEQNVTATQVGGEIFYDVSKDIHAGTELLVWYGEGYTQFMGIPIALKGPTAAGGPTRDCMSTESTAEERLRQNDQGSGYACERCGKVFAYEYYRDKHLKYTRCVDQGDRKFPCHLCSRSFEKRDRLRIHILHVHEKHRPHKCTVCDKSFSQSSSLNKHMRVHSGERPYKCVYCNKAFTASSILRTHIRQHSGEKPFKCKFCGKAFASHAAHDSHVRRTHSKDKALKCPICVKTFQQPYELQFHLTMHTGAERSKVSMEDIDVVG